MAASGLVTTPSTSTMDSLEMSETYLTIPLLTVFSSTNNVHCTVDTHSRKTTNADLPFERQLWSRARMSTVLPTLSSVRSATRVHLRPVISTDCTIRRSPYLSFRGSFSSAAAFSAAAAATLAAFSALKASFSCFALSFFSWALLNSPSPPSTERPASSSDGAALASAIVLLISDHANALQLKRSISMPPCMSLARGNQL
mmetsp:Transcript_22286/g.48997  ORF Transcript_22286/g.48997 Transcript_22286/m.48997 type:complete len:200 (-) Transcript_22286:2-601(-)